MVGRSVGLPLPVGWKSTLLPALGTAAAAATDAGGFLKRKQLVCAGIGGGGGRSVDW